MSPHTRFEFLPAELLSGILTRCSRKDLANLAQAHSNLRVMCHKELINYPLTMEVTPDSLKSWVAYFRRDNTLLTQGARSLHITIYVTRQNLLDALDDVDATVFDMNARPIHPDADRIFPLPSSLRKLSIHSRWSRDQGTSPDTLLLLLLLLRGLPERCPHLEELSIEAHSWHASDEFDKCIRRLARLRKLHFHVANLPRIPNRLSLLPASLTDLYLWTTDMQIQEEEATTVAWVRGIRKLKVQVNAPQCIANVLMMLSRGGAIHLTELGLREKRGNGSPAEIMSWQGALTIGLQELSLLQPPLHALSLTGPSAWSDSLHLPLLHTAVASTLTQLSLHGVDTCIFPSHLPWPCLQSLDLNEVHKMGYQGRLTEPIFPVLTTISMYRVDEIQAPEDLFPALETIEWQGAAMPEQMANLVRHDIKRIDMGVYHDSYEPLWKAMGGHTIDLIVLEGSFSDRLYELAEDGERILPEFPNIRELSINWY